MKTKILSILLFINGVAMAQDMPIQIKKAEPYTQSINVKKEGQPLMVVDGIIHQPENKEAFDKSLSTLNPSDIERVEVLKDEKATRLFGDKGVNGVILVFSKEYVKKQEKSKD
jgi:hypothetical protein